MRKKCEARIPNTCCACESAKHEAGEAYAEYNFINNFERNSFCYKTL